MDNGEPRGIITADTINPAFKRIDYPLRGPLSTRCTEIEKELSQGVEKPFDKVVEHYGDPQGLEGQKPITFIRQTLSLLMYPELLMDDERFPQDAKNRVKEILNNKTGKTMSSYTASEGLMIIRKQIADFITKRDGYLSDPSNIFMTNGGSVAIQVVLGSLRTGLDGNKREGFLIPVPQFSLYAALILEQNSFKIPYFLDEDNGWQLSMDELKEALDNARPHCIPRAMVLINPGNPTGQVFSYKTIQEAIKFCHENHLVLFADEVYQENIYTKEFPFHSCRKVLLDMGPAYKDFQLISLHCASKGYTAECCSRAAYLELHGFDKETKSIFVKKLTTSSCPNVMGQAVMSVMCNPPQPGEESYDLFIKERDSVLESLREKAVMTTNILNSLEGITCNTVTGALYAFPKIVIPQKAIDEAKRLGVEPDYFYASNLLEETGIFVIHGSAFGQKAGTSHFRITIVPPLEETKRMFKRIKKCHQEFLKKYS